MSPPHLSNYLLISYLKQEIGGQARTATCHFGYLFRIKDAHQLTEALIYT